MPLWSQIIFLTLTLAGAVCVGAVWNRVFRSTQARKPKSSPDPTPTSYEARLAALEADQVALWSSLEKVTSHTRKLLARVTTRDIRAEPVDRAPPIGTPKAKLREYFGLTGKTHTEIANLHKNQE